MSDLFNTYEQEFLRLSQSITRQIAEIPTLTGEKKSTVFSDAQKNVDEASTNLQQMVLEIRSIANANTKKELTSKYKQYENDLTKMQKDLKSSRSALPKDGRDQLFAGSSDGSLSGRSSVIDRERLISGNEKIAESSNKIKIAQQTVLETQQIGAGIMQNLNDQTDVLNRTKGNLNTADGYMNNVRRLLSGMGRRAQTNKLILACIILVLLVAIVLILYFSFSNNSPTVEPTPSPTPPTPTQLHRL
jgi:vesicle transport through interaction with t-SNAREs protein 1